MQVSKHKNDKVPMTLSNVRILKLLKDKDGANLKLSQAHRDFQWKLLVQSVYQLNVLNFLDFQ